MAASTQHSNEVKLEPVRLCVGVCVCAVAVNVRGLRVNVTRYAPLRSWVTTRYAYARGKSSLFETVKVTRYAPLRSWRGLRVHE